MSSPSLKWFFEFELQCNTTGLVERNAGSVQHNRNSIRKCWVADSRQPNLHDQSPTTLTYDLQRKRCSFLVIVA
jgi:hypothetical protein